MEYETVREVELIMHAWLGVSLLLSSSAVLCIKLITGSGETCTLLYNYPVLCRPTCHVRELKEFASAKHRNGVCFA
jgi:hypothetical protein